MMLSLVLLLPTAVQFFHSFEKHKHLACEEVSTHIHDQNIDCSLCDFHFSTFNFKIGQPFQFIDTEVFTLVQIAYISSEKNSFNHHFYLRGPPRVY